jgi:hypothetical protein
VGKSSLHTVVEELDYNQIKKWFLKYKDKLIGNNNLLPILMKNSNNLVFKLVKNVDNIKEGNLLVQCLFDKNTGKIEGKYRIIKTYHITQNISNQFDDSGMIVFDKDTILN